jgi:hypothetical protein
MPRINLCKYGFVRWPEEDFSDDGNRFTCYRAGKKIRVSKLVSHGQVYLSIDSGIGELPYEVYKNLPHYHDAEWKWNGVSLAGLTDEDLHEFYEACVAFEKEYEELEAEFKFPTKEEITARAAEVMTVRAKEIKEIQDILAAKLPVLLLTASTYQWAEIQRLFKKLLEETNRDYSTLRKDASLKFCSKDCRELKTSWWYERILEIVNGGC